MAKKTLTPHPTKKTITSRRRTSSPVLSDEQLGALVETPKSKNRFNLRFWKVAVIVLLVSVAIVFLAQRYRGSTAVATIDGMSIPRQELTDRLMERFGSQMLEAMIGEKLILNEAAKQNVSISQDELNAKLTDIEKNLEGTMTLEDSLKLQGVTKEEYLEQLRLQLMIEKMLEKDVSVSAQEVDEYLKANADAQNATDPATQRTKAETDIRNNKISQKFVEWFNQLKENSKVTRSL